MYFTEEDKIAFDKNERNQRNLSFKRAQYMLYDLKYVTFDENEIYSKFYTAKIKSTIEMIKTRWNIYINFHVAMPFPTGMHWVWDYLRKTGMINCGQIFLQDSMLF